MRKTEHSFLSLARDVRLCILDCSFNAHTGHVGSALSIADILTTLYFTHLNVTSKNITSPARDRFILSKGHAAAALYAVLYTRGIIQKKQFDSFGMDRGGLCEHPEQMVAGVEMTSGSLGHGMGFAIGIALGLKKKRMRASVSVLISDGECGEGSVWEAALLAPRLGLDNLTVIVDYNRWQCFGALDEITHIEPFGAKWKSFGWAVQEVNGHDLFAMQKLFKALPFEKGKPNVIIAHTIMGKGIALIEHKHDGHFHVFSKPEYETARRELGAV